MTRKATPTPITQPRTGIKSHPFRALNPKGIPARDRQSPMLGRVTLLDIAQANGLSLSLIRRMKRGTTTAKLDAMPASKFFALRDACRAEAEAEITAKARAKAKAKELAEQVANAKYKATVTAVA